MFGDRYISAATPSQFQPGKCQFLALSLVLGGGFPGDADSEACYMGDLGLIPGSGRSTGETNGLYIGSCSAWLCYSYSECLFLHFESVFLVFLFSALLSYNSHIIFYKFKVYKVMI